MQIIDKILRSDIFKTQPPVLLDIGASGAINPKWKAIARYSVCVAFEPDERELKVSENTASGYKKLYVLNRVASTENTDKVKFYLTRSPFCSSTLKPDNEKLKPWLFQSLFTVEKEIDLPAITIDAALQKLSINYLDWFKADTQGTDLRLFKSISPGIRNTILAAEFEPGIIDAYINEDKLHNVLNEMNDSDYWLSAIQLQGTKRLPDQIAGIGTFAQKRILRNTPGWAELTYLHNTDLKNKRDLLLLFIFAVVEKQYGFAIEVANKGSDQFNDSLFIDCKNAMMNKLKKEKLRIPLVMLKKQLSKLLSGIND